MGKQSKAASSGKSGAGAGGGKPGSGGGGSSGGGSYILDIREGSVALLRFKTKDAMNAMLDPISNALEGTILNRLGHNFALSLSAPDHVALRKALGLSKDIKYVVATLDGDAHSVRHEMCHARFFLHPSYKSTVEEVWSSTLAPSQREHITSFLSRLKYDPCSHVDEFQAYLVTEKSNFFGMDLSTAQEELQATFPPGSWR